MYDHFFLGVKEGSDEADQTGQGLLRGEEEASQECECSTWTSSGSYHSPSRGQGTAAVQH